MNPVKLRALYCVTWFPWRNVNRLTINLKNSTQFNRICLADFQKSYRPVLCTRYYCQHAQKTNNDRWNGLHRRLANYLFGRFFKFVKGYEKILQTKFPRAFHVYQVFAVGIKEFYRDIKLYGTLMIRLNQGKKLSDLKRYEIENYLMMPREIKRVAPVLLISALPFANYVVFPLAYWFPKKLLSSHFWSIQQKLEFHLQDHKQKLLNYRPVFRHLQAKVKSIKELEHRRQCAKMLHKLGSGTHPFVHEILNFKHLFSSGPYSLKQLSFSHVTRLCQLHNLSVLGFRKRRLKQHAAMIRQIDLAILREKIENMNSEELRGSCFLRGVNPVGMSREEMIKWLNLWISITTNLNDDCLSLLLHCPLLLSYNYRTNWSLIH
ncbi:hypothetical protein CHUAL_003248 [Chamberlinius hualienensis]